AELVGRLLRARRDGAHAEEAVDEVGVADTDHGRREAGVGLGVQRGYPRVPGEGEVVAQVLPLDPVQGDRGREVAARAVARLARAGLPVPAGFHVTTEAYRSFVAQFRDAIDPGDPERTKALFAEHDVPAPVAEE